MKAVMMQMESRMCTLAQTLPEAKGTRPMRAARPITWAVSGGTSIRRKGCVAVAHSCDCDEAVVEAAPKVPTLQENKDDGKDDLQNECHDDGG